MDVYLAFISYFVEGSLLTDSSHPQYTKVFNDRLPGIMKSIENGNSL